MPTDIEVLQAKVAKLEVEQKLSTQITVVSGVATVGYLAYGKWGVKGAVLGTLGSILLLNLVSPTIKVVKV